MRELKGRARRLGDDINTDYIITSARKRATLDESVLRNYLLETLDPGFAASVRPGDIIVAGNNFGCGSAMEIAVTVILAAGIPAVLAGSFSRTFFRNALNNGLLPIQCDTAQITEGDSLSLRLEEGATLVSNHSRGLTITAASLPPFVLQVVSVGGLVPYLRKHNGFRT